MLDNEAAGTEKIIPLDASKMRELANGTFANNGFFLKTDAELNDAFFYKSSDSSAVTQRPKLVIEYTLADPDSTPAPTFTPTPTLEISPTPTLLSPTLTFTPSVTPTPTLTFTPSATPTPSVPLFASATFTYDGDGKRVKSALTTNVGTTDTYFIGNYYEVTHSTGSGQAGGVVTKYYYAGTQRIALRKNGVLMFILGDHLGSTSLVTDATGAVINQTQYKAWGEERYSSGSKQTNYGYTGQYSYTDDFGLMFYNARWYDSSLGRFTQADSIVPAGVQGYDRYAYVSNNPLKYTDPTGHREACGDEIGSVCKSADTLLSDFGIKTSGLNTKQKWRVVTSAAITGEAFKKTIGNGISSVDAFRKSFGNISIDVGKGKGPRDANGVPLGNCATTYGSNSSAIVCESAVLFDIGNAVHEFFHVFDKHYQAISTGDDTNSNCGGKAPGCLASNYLSQSWLQGNNGFKCNNVRCVAHPSNLKGYDTSELFANMGENYVMGNFNVDLADHGFDKDADMGKAMDEWMDLSWFLGKMGLK